ncbi:MAG: rhomboid family intramembrane serine protease [Halobacterium sp.]
MTRGRRPTTEFPAGATTLLFTFAFVVLFRLEQNVAYALGITTRRLVTVDAFPLRAVVQLFAPFLHATAGHLVSTLTWFVPFGYFLERRASPVDYVAFVVLSGLVTTMLVPSALVLLGVPVGLGVGASGITHALVGREAAARSRWVVERRALSRTQRAILVVALAGVALAVVAIVTDGLSRRDVTGHATGLLLGALVGAGERYVSWA